MWVPCQDLWVGHLVWVRVQQQSNTLRQQQPPAVPLGCPQQLQVQQRGQGYLQTALRCCFTNCSRTSTLTQRLQRPLQQQQVVLSGWVVLQQQTSCLGSSSSNSCCSSGCVLQLWDPCPHAILQGYLSRTVWWGLRQQPQQQPTLQ